MKISKTLLSITVFCTSAMLIVACGNRNGNTADEVAQGNTDGLLTDQNTINPAGNQNGADITDNADDITENTGSGDALVTASPTHDGNLAEDAGDAVGDAIDKVGDDAGDVADDIGDAVSDATRSVGNAVKDMTGGNARSRR